jgi:hypothetical protein
LFKYYKESGIAILMLAKIKNLFKRKEKMLSNSRNLWDTPLESQSRLCKSPKEDWICVKGAKRSLKCYSAGEPEQPKPKGWLASLMDL